MPEKENNIVSYFELDKKNTKNFRDCRQTNPVFIQIIFSAPKTLHITGILISSCVRGFPSRHWHAGKKYNQMISTGKLQEQS